MAHLGGGAEAHARFKQYEYRANSSLVLTTDSRPRDTHEPTGEPESLWGKIDPKSFGDRAYRGKPPELEEKLKKSKRKKEREPALAPDQKRDSKRRRIQTHQSESVLSLADDGVYQPKTKETRAAYEALLSVIQQQFGGIPQDILTGAADEVLSVLKNDKVKNVDKKKEIERLLNPISNQLFDQLVSIGRLITDFQDGGDAEASAAANGNEEDLDDVGVAVEFEEEDDEEESDFDQVQEESEDDDEDGQDSNGAGAMQMGGIDDEDMEEANEGLTINVQDIDAYWLQRKITQAYEEIDPQQSQKLAEEVLKILTEGYRSNIRLEVAAHSCRLSQFLSEVFGSSLVQMFMRFNAQSSVGASNMRRR